MTTKYYVTMTDRFMSNWGRAENIISKYVVECETLEEARIVEQNANNRSEMRNVRIRETFPNYNPDKFKTDFTNKEKSPRFFKVGGFTKQK